MRSETSLQYLSKSIVLLLLSYIICYIFIPVLFFPFVKYLFNYFTVKQFNKIMELFKKCTKYQRQKIMLSKKVKRNWRKCLKFSLYLHLLTAY